MKERRDDDIKREGDEERAKTADERRVVEVRKE